jgi:NADP-dependent 3-hydroxy acid dehydrogenase YdfG
MRLKDKVVLVTGSTTGIGEAIATRVLAEGGLVMYQGRNAERGNALSRAAGDRARFVAADLAEAHAPATVIDATSSEVVRCGQNDSKC